MIWSPVCELPYGPRSVIAASSEAGQMAASDYVPNFFKNRLHLAGRPQMSTLLLDLIPNMDYIPCVPPSEGVLMRRHASGAGCGACGRGS